MSQTFMTVTKEETVEDSVVNHDSTADNNLQAKVADPTTGAGGMFEEKVSDLTILAVNIVDRPATAGLTVGRFDNSHQPPVSCHQSPFTNNQPPATSHQSPVTNNQSPATSHQSPVTSHQQPVSSHQSPVTHNQSPATMSPVTSHKTTSLLPASHQSPATETDQSPATSHQSPTTESPVPPVPRITSGPPISLQCHQSAVTSGHYEESPVRQTLDAARRHY